jgi:hypothetical protein
MAFQLEIEQHFSVEKTMDGAATTLVAAETAVTLVVTSVIVTALTPAAFAMYVGDSSGTVKVLRLPASKPDAGNQAAIQLVHGIQLTKGEALVAAPETPGGPVVHVVVEGWKIRI